jgi:tetratricopeptide (TPR) repeat protein
VVTSDHGEALGDHGEKTHGLFAYESTLRVPLILWSAAFPNAGSDGREARHIDLLPTILDAAGVAAEVTLPGHSLLRPAPVESATYFEALGPNINRGWAPLRGVLQGGQKFISLPLPELYDLHDDPAETKNLVQSATPIVRSLRRLLPEESQWPPAGRSDLSDDEARQLRSLGYLSGSAASKTEYGVQDDPKNLVEVDSLAHRFVESYQSGDLDQAVLLARELVAQRPSMGLGYYHLAQALLDREDLGEALEVMGTAYSRGLATPGLRRQLALSLTEVGRSLEAIQVLDSLGDSADPDTLNVRGLVLAEAGRFDEATRALQAVFENDPNNPEAHQNLARVELLRSRWSAVREHARAALELNDSLPLAWNYLGMALYNLGAPGEALDAWQRATSLAPRDFDLLYNLAIVSAEQGRIETAREALRRFIAEAPKERYGADIVAARQRLSRLDD